MGECWYNVKLRQQIAAEADKYLNAKNGFGIALFDSRAAVVEKALIEFFERHSDLLKPLEATPSGTKTGLLLKGGTA